VHRLVRVLDRQRIRHCDCAVTLSAPGSFTQDLKGLSPSTTYQVRTMAENAKGKVVGSTVSFTTAPQAYLEGIDVSVYQRAIDWTKVAAAGKSFALIRSTYGDVRIDSTFPANIRGAYAAGIRAGPYHCKGSASPPPRPILP